METFTSRNEKLEQPEQYVDVTEENFSSIMEQAFHRMRHKEKAAARNERYVQKWLSWLGVREEYTEEDIAYEEAQADNAEMIRRTSQEYVENWQEKYVQTIKQILEKRDGSPEETKHIRPMIIFAGGAMEGAQLAGQMRALEAMGLAKDGIFSVIVGFSAGSGPAALFATSNKKQIHNAGNIFRNVCSSKDFLDVQVSAIPPKVKVHLDTGVVASAMSKGGEYELDQEAVRRSSAEVLVTAKNYETGNVDILDLKTKGENMIDKLVASANVPFGNRTPKVINGEGYYDSATGEFPIEDLIEKYKPTCVLVLPNMPFNFEMLTQKQGISSAVERATSKLASMRFFSNVEMLMKMNKMTKFMYDKFGKEEKIPIGVAFTPRAILGPIDNNINDVDAAIMETEAALLKEFRAVEKNMEKTIYTKPGETANFSEETRL